MSVIRPTHDLVPGSPIEDVDTPALLLDLDAFERNADRLMAGMRANGVGWRPHTKAHKSPVIASLQVAIGAHGVTCAKVSEAEVFVEAGFRSILIAYELPRPFKWRRAAALQEHAEVLVCIDDPAQIAMASDAAREVGVELPVIVELDVGMERCGIAPREPALDLARRIGDSPGLRLAGFMGYEGHTLTMWPQEVKDEAIRAALTPLVETAEMARAEGLGGEIVSAGGSGSYMTAATVPGVTELQAGGACLMDRFYAADCHLGELGFEHALTVVTSVVGLPSPERVILDGGFKTMSKAPGMPPASVVGFPDAEFDYLSAEHSSLRPGVGAAPLRIGDRVTVIPDYSDTTTFLHDAFVAHRSGRVEGLIPLATRGRLT